MGRRVMNSQALLFVVLHFGCGSTAYAAELDPLFSDNAVLQREIALPVFGILLFLRLTRSFLWQLTDFLGS